MPKQVVTVDFETDSIESRPNYPPKPRGVSIMYPGKAPKYLAWGHPTENNCTEDQASDELWAAWQNAANQPLLFHNAKFDLDVAFTHWNFPLPDWNCFHDTLLLLFLHEPHASSLSLKPSAERILGMAPTEQEAVRLWLVKYGIVKSTDKQWGAHIYKAPGGLVGEYAKGDVVRTKKLFDHLYPLIANAGSERGHGQSVLGSYDRERRLLPVLLENEHAGMRADYSALEQDRERYLEALTDVDEWVREELGAPGLNIDSNDELAAALAKAKVVTAFKRTPTGKLSVSKKNLTPDMFHHKGVASAIGYRNRLSTCLSMFVEPWLELAGANGGLIYTNWNQVRQSHSDNTMGGARTGRLSCSPNFMNIPKVWDDKGDGYEHPRFLDVPELPLMRKYILPDDEKSLFCHRDYNQQELRILAHFENDKLCAAYNENHNLDIHTFVQQAIQDISGLELERRFVKILNFGLVYGMGLLKLMLSMGLNVTFGCAPDCLHVGCEAMRAARRIKGAQRGALPGLAILERDIKYRGATKIPITTWGGRQYLAEPPKMINGVLRSFEYKLLNYLIQGSAADCTKEALIRYHAVRKNGRFMVTVHDEINLSVPKKDAKAELKLLKEAMESVEFDVPMVTDAKMGPSWGSLEKVEE